MLFSFLLINFWVDREDSFYSILPTTTQYSRNAIFSGLMPSEIERVHPNMWLNDDEPGFNNNFEKDLLHEQLRRLGSNIPFSYNKVSRGNFEEWSTLCYTKHVIFPGYL